jgi:peptidoglycan LD-endopeptidase LytH
MRSLRALPVILLLVACARLPVATAPAPVPIALPPGSAVGAVGEMDDMAYLRVRRLLFPVVGVDPATVHDSFFDARDGGRTHRALDIMAPRGTPVLAADSGRILRMSTNTLGGITIYAVDPGERIVYYYAHLDRYFDGLMAGREIARGDTLGYVGTTGNAPKNVPHLHFQVMRMPANRKLYWNGEAIDPFPFFSDSTDRERQIP